MNGEHGRGDGEAQLCAEIVGSANELITVFDADGTIVFVSAASRVLLGFEPAAIVGRRVLEFVHPDDLPRAVETLRIAATFGSSKGTTLFRLRTADGFLPLEMTVANVRHNGRALLMTVSRTADTRCTLDAALRVLLEDRPFRDVIASVCDLITWREIGSHVAISRQRRDGQWESVSTPGCPEALSGGSMPEGSAWAEAIRTGRDAIADDPSQMDAAMRAIAEQSGRGGYWISPVGGLERPAVISVWTASGGFPPLLHAEGMAMARQFMRLIVRSADQRERLDRAARFDELTGLPNRRSFFDAVATSAHGAILYCDLDAFKPANDHYGHAAGDEVLRQVARRLRDALRAGDTVARIGGDEFAIICPASTAADAAVLANRIRSAVERPIDIGVASVRVGISIGMAHTTDRLGAASVAAADRDLYAAKAQRRASSPRA